MIALYTDENVLEAMTQGLRPRDVDVLTAREDGRVRTDDVLLLKRATLLRRVLFSQDTDLVAIAVERQRNNDLGFSGVLYSHQKELVGVCINDMELILSAYNYEEMEGTVHFLPL